MLMTRWKRKTRRNKITGRRMTAGSLSITRCMWKKRTIDTYV